MVNIQRPSGVNVGVNNPGEIIYIKGNETTDGSFRITLNALETLILFETRVASVWVEADITVSTALTVGQVPKADTDGSLIYGGATVDVTSGEWTFDQSINIPSGSINVGDVMTVSEGGGDLVVANLILSQMAFSVNSIFSDAAGALVPSYVDYGAPITINVNLDDSQIITTNPLTIQLTQLIVPSTNLRVIDRVVVRANTGGVTNFRVKITDNATGLVMRYFPNKAAFDGVTDGFDLQPGDNTFFLADVGTDAGGNFFLGYVPIAVFDGQLIDIEFIADAMNLLGNISDTPFLVVEVHDGPEIDLLAAPSGGFTEGSIPFADSAGQLTEDNANFFWDESNSRLGIGTNTPGHLMDITGDDGVLLMTSAGLTSSVFVDFESSVGATPLSVGYNENFDISLISANPELRLVSDSADINLIAATTITFNDQVTVAADGQTLSIESLSATDTVAVNLFNSSAVEKLDLSYSETSDTSRLQSAVDFTFNAVTGALNLSTDTASEDVNIDSSGGFQFFAAETSQIETDTGTLTLLTSGDDLILNSSSNNIILNSEIVQLIGGSAGYNLEHSGDDLRLVSLNQDSILEFFTQTGDGTEIARFAMFDVGTAASQVNSERLNFTSNNGEWLISMVATGTGSQRDLKIGSTAGDPVNFVALADGSTSIGSEAGLDVTVNSGNHIILNTGVNDGVGIDIAAPASCLHVFEDSGNTGAGAGITMEQDGSGDAVLHFITTGLQDWSLGIDQTNSNTFTIRPNIALTGAGPLQILTTGEVGIGGTPIAGNVLDVITGTADIVRLRSNKAVQIEQGNITASSTDLFFNRADVGNNQSEFYLSNSNNATDTNRRFKLNFTDAGIEGGLTVGFGGFVGIAQDLPDHPLTIGTTAAQDADVSLEDVSGNTMFNMRYNSGSNVIQLHATTQGTSHGMNLLSQSGAMAVEAHNSGNTAMIHSQDAHVIVRSGGDPISQERTATGGAITDADAVLTSLNTAATNGVSLDKFQGDRDPHSNITGAGGDVYSRVSGVESGTYQSLEATTGTNWFKNRVFPSSSVEINSAAQLTALETSANTITVTAAAELHIHLNVDILSSTVFVIEAGASFSFSSNSGARFTSISTGTLFTIGETSVQFNRAQFLAGAGATFLDYEAAFGDSIVFNEGLVFGFDMGEVRRISTSDAGPLVTFRSTFIIDWATLTVIDSDLVMTNASVLRLLTGTSSGPFTEFIQHNLSIPILKIDGLAGGLESGESVIRIDAGLTDTTSALISDSTIFFSGGAATMFDTTGTAPTAFAAVASNSIVTTVTSVVDSSGVARFTHAGTPPFDGSTVTLTGFSESTYNVTGRITFSNATSFEIDFVAFVADDSGTSTMTGVTITSGSHGLSPDTGVTINTDDATDYDGHFVTYNITGNTFDIAATFTQTETGTWCTEGLDQSDPNVLSLGNPGSEDSKYIATAFVNDNSTANGAIVNNTFTDMVFGTAGVALIEGTTIERWKLVDELNGTFEYTGIEPFSGLITFDFTMVSSGGTVDFRHKWQHDVGAGFVDLPDDVESLTAVGSNSRPVTKTFPLAAVTGDQIKPQVTRNSGTSGITTTYASIYATQ